MLILTKNWKKAITKVFCTVVMLLMFSTTITVSNNIHITSREQITSQTIMTYGLSVAQGTDSDFQYINRTNKKQQLLLYSNLESTSEHNLLKTQKQLSNQLNELNVNISTAEFRINKYNGSKNIYINVTDSFNILTAANLTIYTNMTDPNLPVAVSQISVKDKLKKALSMIDTGRWVLTLDDVVLGGATAGTYNITFLATKENYTPASATVIMHLETYDQSPPVLLYVTEPEPMIDVRPNNNALNFTFAAKDDFWIRDVVFGGVMMGCPRPDEMPIGDPNSDIFANGTYVRITNFEAWAFGEGVVNVSIIIIDENYNYVMKTIPVIADTVNPRIKISSPTDGKTYSITSDQLSNVDTVSFVLTWTAEDYSGISKYEVYCSYYYNATYHSNEKFPGDLILTTNNTRATIHIPAPPANVVNTIYCYSITVYCYDTCGNANWDFIDIYLKVLPSDNSNNNSVDENKNNNSPTSSWANQWGVYVLGGGIFAYGVYKFIRYLSKHTIKEPKSPKKKNKKVNANPRTKAKSYVQNWKKRNKKR